LRRERTDSICAVVAVSSPAEGRPSLFILISSHVSSPVFWKLTRPLTYCRRSRGSTRSTGLWERRGAREVAEWTRRRVEKVGGGEAQEDSWLSPCQSVSPQGSHLPSSGDEGTNSRHTAAVRLTGGMRPQSPCFGSWEATSDGAVGMQTVAVRGAGKPRSGDVIVFKLMDRNSVHGQ